jgi:hypothetical protein
MHEGQPNPGKFESEIADVEFHFPLPSGLVGMPNAIAQGGGVRAQPEIAGDGHQQQCGHEEYQSCRRPGNGQEPMPRA